MNEATCRRTAKSRSGGVLCVKGALGAEFKPLDATPKAQAICDTKHSLARNVRTGGGLTARLIILTCQAWVRSTNVLANWRAIGEMLGES
jgi:hypothetical protein